MSRIFAVVLLVFSLGCAGGEIAFQPDPDNPPILVLKPGFFGRGCLFVDYTDDAGVAISIVVAQDGTSDWSAFRLLDSLKDTVGSVFGAAPGDGMDAPSGAQGCAQFYQQGIDDSNG